MPLAKKEGKHVLVYKIGFTAPFNDLIYDEGKYYILPGMVGRKSFGLREARVFEDNGRNVILYKSKKYNTLKLNLKHKVRFQSEREVEL
jgi:hypothetical protein